jgi:hypothetical protein
MAEDTNRFGAMNQQMRTMMESSVAASQEGL